MRPIVYDLSRLALRMPRGVPSGIDRVDMAWAKAALSHPNAAGVIVTGLMGQRFADRDVGRLILDAVEEAWSECIDPQDDPAFLDARAWLLGDDGTSAIRPLKRRAGSARARTIARLFQRAGFGKSGIFPARDPKTTVPDRALYLNVSQFPLALPRLSRWLWSRRDVRAALMVHDMLPISRPEFFPPGELRQHDAFLRACLGRADDLIVPSAETADQVLRFAADHGLQPPKIAVHGLSVDPVFAAPAQVDEPLDRVAYFIACGTIEPRKNLLFLLNVWRELHGRLGDRTPRLVLVGARGWENENILDALERSDVLRSFVHEVSGLGTRGVKHLLDHCRALLMPSFEEGFGLPVLEAISAGVPVITSAVPALRTVPDANVTVLDPIDGVGWSNAISACVNGILRPENNRRRMELCSFDHIHSLIRDLIIF